MHLKRVIKVVLPLGLLLLLGPQEPLGTNFSSRTPVSNLSATRPSQPGSNVGNAAPPLDWTKQSTLWSAQPTGSDAATWEFLPVDDSTFTAAAGLSANDIWSVGYVGKSYRDTNALVAHWNGKAWDQIHTLTTGEGEQWFEDVITIAHDDVWAVGKQSTELISSEPLLSYGDARRSWKPLIAHWDGKEWKVVPGPNADQKSLGIHAIAPARPDDIWAVGSQSLIWHWDGHNWTDFAGFAGSRDAHYANIRDDYYASTRNEDYANRQSVYSVEDIAVVSSNDIWAIGDGVIFHWDGKAWNEVTKVHEGNSTTAVQPGTYFRSIGVVSANDVWAVSSWSIPGGCDHSRVQTVHWNGISWSEVATPYLPYNCVGSATLGSIAVTSTDSVWALGYWQDRLLLLNWNGKAWSVNPCPTRGADNDDLALSLDHNMVSNISASNIVSIPGNGVYIVGKMYSGEGWQGSRGFILRPGNGTLCPSTPTP